MKQTINKINDNFDAVLSSIISSINLQPYDERSEFYFSFDRDDLIVEGCVESGADCDIDGDGYDTPHEYHFRNQWANVNDIEIYSQNKETGEEETLGEAETDSISQRLQDALNLYFEHN